ncbi:MAG TPA: hypothetical protein VNN79_24165 [Actinomycetota bacterium]|nr:hypothetical protein [Actinomycetota bacterium]
MATPPSGWTHIGHILNTDGPAGTKVESAGVRLGEITAWRLWWVDGHGHRLRSVVRDEPWLPGVPMTGDPKPDNRAGVYAFREPADAYCELSITETPLVLGTVKLWGRYVEHERGYRAEFARITSLVATARRDRTTDIFTLRDLYLDHRCPAGLTPVADPEGRVVGVTTVRSSWSGRYADGWLPPVTVCEPMEVSAPADWLTSEGPTRMIRHQTHHWRGLALLLEPGQDPTWLPGWLPLPVGDEKTLGDND